MTLRVTQEAEHFLTMWTTISSTWWILLHGVIFLQEVWNMKLNRRPVYKRQLWTYRENAAMYRIPAGCEDRSGFIWLNTKSLSVHFNTVTKIWVTQDARTLLTIRTTNGSNENYEVIRRTRGGTGSELCIMVGPCQFLFQSFELCHQNVSFHSLTVRKVLPLKQIWYLHNGTKHSFNCNKRMI